MCRDWEHPWANLIFGCGETQKAKISFCSLLDTLGWPRHLPSASKRDTGPIRELQWQGEARQDVWEYLKCPHMFLSVHLGISWTFQAIFLLCPHRAAWLHSGSSLPKVSVEEWLYSAFPLALFSCISAVNAAGQRDPSACRHVPAKWLAAAGAPWPGSNRALLSWVPWCSRTPVSSLLPLAQDWGLLWKLRN